MAAGGRPAAAIVLYRLLFWSSRTPDGWVTRKRAAWITDTGLTESSVRRALAYLEEAGLVRVRVRGNVRAYCPDPTLSEAAHIEPARGLKSSRKAAQYEPDALYIEKEDLMEEEAGGAGSVAGVVAAAEVEAEARDEETLQLGSASGCLRRDRKTGPDPINLLWRHFEIGWRRGGHKSVCVRWTGKPRGQAGHLIDKVVTDPAHGPILCQKVLLAASRWAEFLVHAGAATHGSSYPSVSVMLSRADALMTFDPDGEPDGGGGDHDGDWEW